MNIAFRIVNVGGVAATPSRSRRGGLDHPDKAMGNAYDRRAVITGIHAIVFSQDVERTRAFFRDTLKLDSVDAGGGWLIFAMPPAELAAHPTDDHPHHELYLMCDDIHATVAELKAKGIDVATDIAEERWGLTTSFKLPGAGRMAIYEPKHSRPRAPPADSSDRFS